MTQIRSLSKDPDLVQKKRLVIMESAVELFLRKGYNRVTMQEIADYCGMAAGNLYRYIGSKDDILHLISTNSVVVMRRLAKQFSQPTSDGPEILLKKCIKRYFELLDSSSDANVFCNREILHFSHEDRHLLLKTQEEFVTLFEKIITQGAEKGIFKVKNPNIVAHNIVVLGADWCLRRWYLKNRYTLEQYTANQIEMVLKNILPSC